MFLAKGPSPFFISSYQTKTFLERKVTEANAIKILFSYIRYIEKEKITSFMRSLLNFNF